MSKDRLSSHSNRRLEVHRLRGCDIESRLELSTQGGHLQSPMEEEDGNECHWETAVYTNAMYSILSPVIRVLFRAASVPRVLCQSIVSVEAR